MEQSVKAVVKTPFSAYIKGALKGTLISMVFTTAAILLFALIIQETKMAGTAASIVYQILRIGGIMLASYFAIKGFAGKSWIMGGMAGTLFIVLSYLLVSLIEGIFGNVALLFSNMLMGLLIGMVFAIIMVSFKGSKAGPSRPKHRARRSPFMRMQRTRSVKKVANSGQAGI
jgi:putative membrane protein, TIGR04086 family/integral membrane protein, TIGR04097 family